MVTKAGGRGSNWGGHKDKDGLSWKVTSPSMGQYIGGSDPAGAKRATEAMLGMNKIILDELKLAYESATR